jgi:hypothetical protein
LAPLVIVGIAIFVAFFEIGTAFAGLLSARI